MKLSKFYRQSSELLESIDSASLDAELIICHVLGLSRTAFILNTDLELSDTEISAINKLLKITPFPLSSCLYYRKKRILES